MKVLVYGASGSQQTPVVEELIANGHQVVATTHTPSKVGMLKGMGAEAIVADMANYDELLEANKNVEAVSLLIPFFLANPADALTYAKNAIDAALAGGVKLLVWNTSGFIPAFRTGNAAIDVRIDIEVLITTVRKFTVCN